MQCHYPGIEPFFIPQVKVLYKNQAYSCLTQKPGKVIVHNSVFDMMNHQEGKI